MTRKVLVTGHAGPLGNAIFKAFQAQGDYVEGVDPKGTVGIDEFVAENTMPIDVLICCARVDDWHGHHALALRTRVAIVNISSIYGVLGNDPAMYPETGIASTPAAYAAAKGAMVSLTRWQATNLAPVRSNCICPGGIQRDHSPLFVSRYSAKVPLRRMATEDDIVGPVLFLASDAARYVTGQVLMVDGGLSSW